MKEADKTPVYNGIPEAKSLLRCLRSGALATLSPGMGHPFASLVNVGTDFDGAPIFLMSRLAIHTTNLEADSRDSVLLSQGGKGDPLAHPRLTMIGRIQRTTDPRIKTRFLSRHPKSALYADFSDFSFWKMEVAGAHLNGGFARAADFSAAEILTHLEGADALLNIEQEALAHMNQDHGEALRLYATVLGKEADGPWKATGLDPEGLDLMKNEATLRIPFETRITNGVELRAALKLIGDKARA